MLLRSLVDVAAHLDDLPVPGFARRRVRWAIDLDGAGRPRLPHLVDLTEDGGKRPGREMHVPDVQRSGTRPPPFLAVDRLDYVLGRAQDASKAKAAARNHEAFTDLVCRAAEATGSPGLRAVATFLAAPTVDVPDTADRVAFRVDGKWVHDEPAVRAFWQEEVLGRKARGRRGRCLVCGAESLLADTIPNQLPIGAVPDQEKQLAVVSMNKPAHGRNGDTGLRHTPICMSCATTSIAALTHLLKSERHSHRFQSSRSTLAWWMPSGREFDPFAVLDDPSTDDPAAIIDAPESARPVPGVASEAFHAVLGSASGARFVVRRWLDRSLDDVHRAVEAWFDDHRIVSARTGAELVFPLWRLASATGAWDRAMNRTGDPAPGVHDALAVAALDGSAPPIGVLGTLLSRFRADHHVTDARAALLRLMLRRFRLASEDTTMPGLNDESTDPAYVCGRLLAVVDALQYAALGEVGASIADRMLGRASVAPQSIFPRVLANTRAYVKKLRRTNPGAAAALDRRLNELMAKLDHSGFPRSLSLPEQGRFFLGFHHQRAADAAARREAAASRASTTKREETNVG